MALTFNNPKAYIAELIGTALLIFVGCIAGSIGANMFGIDSLMVAAVFALAFIGLVYCFGDMCDCHFNPLISLSMFISGKLDKDETLWYVIAQFIGGIAGAVAAFIVVSQMADTANIFLYPSMYGRDDDYIYIQWFGALIVEFFFAVVLCYVALKATETKKIEMKSGAIIAVAMFGLICLGCGMTGTAVNPAKSVGTAFAMVLSTVSDKWDALIDLWLFIIAPALGVVAASFLYLVVSNTDFDLNDFIKTKLRPHPKAAPADSVETEEPVAEDLAEEPAAEPVVEEAPAEEVPAEEPAVEEAPAEEVPAEETIAEEPVAEVPVEDVVVEATPAEEPVAEGPVEDIVIEAEPQPENKE